MTESYVKGRAEFKAVTGIELPVLENITVDEFPYEEGATSYELDITENVTRSTFDAIVAFFDTALASWTKEGPTTAGDYTDIWYRNNTDSIGITWDSHNVAVYVHAIMGGNDQPAQPQEPETNMTVSYKNGRNSFYAISGIWLPELENIELDADSSFNVQKKEAQFIVPSTADTFTSIVGAVKTAIQSEPLADNNNHWEQDGFMAFWEWDYEAGGRMHKVTIQLENNTYTHKITAGYWFRDYYTLTLTAGTGGTATLEIAGRGQEGNKAHVVYNTASELTATPSIGYEFVGFYEGNAKVSEDNPYRYMIVKDVSIEARFQEIPSNMDEGYKRARCALYEMSGIVLPELENATTDHVEITPDENKLRDSFQCEFVFPTAAEAREAYASFRTAITAVEGNQEETSNNEYGAMDIWSPLYEDVAVPYRDDVMMNMQAEETSFFLMWRKQPIVFYSVEVDGNGKAYVSYTGSDYKERQVERYWEIADAFAGKVVAEADDGNEFVGWYVGNDKVSSDATYRFSYYNQTIDFTEITFVAKFEELPPVEMTESYASARTSFQTVSGLLLPELATVTGFFEDLGANMYMVDISGATQDTLNSVISAFDARTGSTSTIDGYGKNVWKYTSPDEDAICELSAFYSENIVVIMYAEKQMSYSYAAARDVFLRATGVTLPVITDVDGDIAFGDTYLMFDMVDGENLTHDTYELFLAFFNGLSGWTGKEDEHSSEEYPTYIYNNATSGVSIQVVWNGESENGGIYLNVFDTPATFNKYSAAKNYISKRFEIDLPEKEGVSVDFSCAADATWMTFDLTKESDFTESEYNGFVNAISVKLGDGKNESDEYQKRTTWTVEERMWDVTWDLETGLAINFG